MVGTQLPCIGTCSLKLLSEKARQHGARPMQAAGSACGVARALRSAQLWGERARYERSSLALSDVLASRSTVLECTTLMHHGVDGGTALHGTLLW